MHEKFKFKFIPHQYGNISQNSSQMSEIVINCKTQHQTSHILLTSRISKASNYNIKLYIKLQYRPKLALRHKLHRTEQARLNTELCRVIRGDAFHRVHPVEHREIVSCTSINRENGSLLHCSVTFIKFERLLIYEYFSEENKLFRTIEFEVTRTYDL